MKKQTLITSLVGFLILSLTLISCKNNDNNDDDNVLPDASFAKEITKAEAISNEIGTLADYAVAQEAQKSITNDFPFGNCATITFDLQSNPKKVTIDFGETNCLCVDNRLRKGKIIIEYTGNYRQEGSIRDVYTENYFINDNQVILDRKVTNTGFNSNNYLEFSIVEEGQVNWSDGGVYTWNSNRTREWIEGESTMSILDDVYLINGTAQGQNDEGDTFYKEIISPLKYKINCANIVSGIVNITVNNSLNILINFGDGECDHTAIVTILGISFEIILW